MKKIFIIMFVTFLNIAFQSCTPQSVSGDSPVSTEEDCCGDGSPIPPPPPPPSTGG